MARRPRRVKGTYRSAAQRNSRAAQRPAGRVVREVRRQARLTRRLGKLPAGTIVPIGTPYSRTRSVVRYRDRQTGQLVRPGRRPARIVRHPRTGRFITRTEDTLLRKRRQRMTRTDARTFLRVSPRARRYLNDLPDAWSRRLVTKTTRNLRAGQEPRIATARAIRETVREIRQLRERRGEDVRTLSGRSIMRELREVRMEAAQRRYETETE